MIYYFNNSTLRLKYTPITKEFYLIEQGTSKKPETTTKVDMEFKSFQHFIKYCKSDKILTISNKFNLKEPYSFQVFVEETDADIEFVHIEEEFRLYLNKCKGNLVLFECNISKVEIKQSNISLDLEECTNGRNPTILSVRNSVLTGKCQSNVSLHLDSDNHIKDFTFLCKNIDIVTPHFARQVFENVIFDCTISSDRPASITFDSRTKTHSFLGNIISDIWFNNCQFNKGITDYKLFQCVFINTLFKGLVQDCYFRQCLFTNPKFECDFYENTVEFCFGTYEVIEHNTFEY